MILSKTVEYLLEQKLKFNKCQGVLKIFTVQNLPRIEKSFCGRGPDFF